MVRVEQRVLDQLQNEFSGTDETHGKHERQPLRDTDPSRTRRGVDRYRSDRTNNEVLRATEPGGPPDASIARA
jgi:hypothetical protein